MLVYNTINIIRNITPLLCMLEAVCIYKVYIEYDQEWTQVCFSKLTVLVIQEENQVHV